MVQGRTKHKSDWVKKMHYYKVESVRRKERPKNLENSYSLRSVRPDTSTRMMLYMTVNGEMILYNTHKDME